MWSQLNWYPEPLYLTFHLTFWINLPLQPQNQHKITWCWLIILGHYTGILLGWDKLKLSIFKFCFSSHFFSQSVSHIPLACLPACYEVNNDLEPLTLLPLYHICLPYRHAWPRICVCVPEDQTLDFPHVRKGVYRRNYILSSIFKRLNMKHGTKQCRLREANSSVFVVPQRLED